VNNSLTLFEEQGYAEKVWWQDFYQYKWTGKRKVSPDTIAKN